MVIPLLYQSANAPKKTFGPMQIRTILLILMAVSIACTHSKATASKSDDHSNGRRVPKRPFPPFSHRTASLGSLGILASMEQAASGIASLHLKTRQKFLPRKKRIDCLQKRVRAHMRGQVQLF